MQRPQSPARLWKAGEKTKSGGASRGWLAGARGASGNGRAPSGQEAGRGDSTMSVLNAAWSGALALCLSLQPPPDQDRHHRSCREET